MVMTMIATRLLWPLTILIATFMVSLVTSQSLSTLVPLAPEAIGNTVWYAGSSYASSRSRATDGPRNSAKFGIIADITCVADTTLCFVADTTSSSVRVMDITDGLEGIVSSLTAPGSISSPSFVLESGTNILYVGDLSSQSIKIVNRRSGAISTLIGRTGSSGCDGGSNVAIFKQPYAACMGADNTTIYLVDRASNNIRRIAISADGQSATSTLFAGSYTSSGITDSSNSLSARFNVPSACAYDAALQRLFIADTGNNLIRAIQITSKTDPTQNRVSTFAGYPSNCNPGFTNGAALSARFNGPTGLAWSSINQILFVADSRNHVIRQIKAGQVTTLAGTPQVGGCSDQGSTSLFDTPMSISKKNDHLFVTEYDTGRVRRIAIQIEAIPSPNPIGLTQGRPVTVTLSLTRKCSSSATIGITTGLANVYFPTATSIQSVYATNTYSNAISTQIPFGALVKDTTLVLAASGSCRDQGFIGNLDTFPIRAFAAASSPWPPPFDYYSIIDFPTQLYSGEVMTQAGMWIPSIPLADIVVTPHASLVGTFSPSTFTWGITSNHVTQRISFAFTAPVVSVISTTVLTTPAPAAGGAAPNYGGAGPQTITILPTRSITVTNMPTAVNAGSSYIVTISIGSAPVRQSLILGFAVSTPSLLVTISPSSYTFTAGSSVTTTLTITGASLLDIGTGTVSISLSGVDAVGYKWATGNGVYTFNTVAVRYITLALGGNIVNFVPGVNTTLALTPSTLPKVTSMTVTPAATHAAITFSPPVVTFVKNGVASQTVVVIVPAGLTTPSTGSISVAFGGSEGNQYTYQVPATLGYTLLAPSLITVPATVDDTWAGLKSSTMVITVGRVPIYKPVIITPTTGVTGITFTPSSVTINPSASSTSFNVYFTVPSSAVSTSGVITWTVSGIEAVGYVQPVATTAFNVLSASGAYNISVEPWPALVADGTSYKNMKISLSRPTPTTLYVYFAATCIDMDISPYPVVVAAGQSQATFTVSVDHKTSYGSAASLLTSSATPSTESINGDEEVAGTDNDVSGDSIIMIDNPVGAAPVVTMGRRLLATQDGVGGNLVGLKCFSQVTLTLGGTSATQFRPPSPYNVTIYHRGYFNWQKTTNIVSGTKQNFTVMISRLPLQVGQSVSVSIDIVSYGRWVWWNWFTWWNWCWRRAPTPLTVSKTTLTWTYGGKQTQSFVLGADTNDAGGDRYWEMYFSVQYSSSSSSASRDYRLGKHSVTDNDGYGDHDGNDMWWYDTWYESVAFINILRRTVAVYPTLTSIKFSDAATSLIFAFDIPTNIPGTSTVTFPSSVTSCNSLIDVATAGSVNIALLGASPTCQWTSDSSLEIILGSGATVVPGSVISLRGGVIGNRVSPTVVAPVAAVTGVVQGPANPTPPTVVLITVSSVGLCSDLFLDARQSTGLLRGFGNYTWTVASTDFVGIPSIPALQAALTANYQLASFTISSTLLTINATYIFTVTVTNFLGATSTASTKIVHKFGVPLPTLTVMGPTTLPQASQLTISSGLRFPPCVSIGIVWPFVWTLASEPVASTTNPPNGGSNSGAISQMLQFFVLPTITIQGNVLTAGWIYTFQAQVSALAGPEQGSVVATTTVEIIPSAIAAVISGGNPLASTLYPLILDASSSSDPDDAPATTADSPSPNTLDFNSGSFAQAMAEATAAKETGASSAMTDANDAELTYVWSCALIPTLNWTDLNTDCGDAWYALTNTSITMAVPAGTLLPERKYTFTVTVSSAIFNRSSSASILVTTATVPADLSTLVQVLAVSLAASSTQAGIASSFYAQVPPGSLATHESLRLTGKVALLRGNMDTTALKYIWSELGGLDVDAVRTSQPNTPSLVLPAYTLRAGRSYTFRLTVQSVSIATGEVIASSYSDLVRQTSTAPVLDSKVPVMVSPSSGGLALTTLFTFSAGGFSGDLEPFTYTFKLVQANGIEVILGSPYQYVPTVADYLPAGICTIAVEVMNLVGETTRRLTSVIVGDVPTPAPSPAAAAVVSLLTGFSTMITPSSATGSDATSSSVTDATSIAISVTNGILAQAQRASSAYGAVSSIRLISDVLNIAPVTLTTEKSVIGARVILRENLVTVLTAYAANVDVQQVAQTLYSLTSGSPLELSNTTLALSFQLVSAAIDALISEQIIYSGNSTSLLTSVLSNLLGAAEDCTQVDQISSLADRLIDVLLWDAIAGEEAGMVVTANIAIAALRTFSSVPIVPQLIAHPGGMNLQLPVDVISIIDGDWADVHMISYATWTRVPFCYASSWSNVSIINVEDEPNVVVASPITAVSIFDWYARPVVVSGLVNPIALNQSLPLFDPTTMQCSYIDRDTNQWSTHGCVTITQTDSSVVSCQCHQLVEFAVWGTPSEIIPIVPTTDSVAVYAVYGFFYTIAATTSAVQLVRNSWYKRNAKMDATVVQHVFVLAIAMFYSITSFMRARMGWSSLSIDRESFAGIGLLMAVPYMIQFLAFTVLVADWTSMYHIILQNRGSSPFVKLRLPFVIANLLLALFVFALFGGMGGTSDDSKAKQIAVAASSLIFILTCGMVIIYVAYGRRLIATVALPVGANVDEQADGLHTKVKRVRHLFMVTVAFCACLVLQSLLWLISYASMASFYSNGTGILVVFYTVNLISLAIILNIFGKGIHAAAKEAASTPASPAAAMGAAARKSVKFDIESPTHGTSPDIDRSRSNTAINGATDINGEPTSPVSPMSSLQEPLAPTSPTPLIPPAPPARPPRPPGVGLRVTIAEPDVPDVSVSPEVIAAAAAMTAEATKAHSRRTSTMTMTPSSRRPVRASFIHLADDSPPSSDASSAVVASSSFDAPAITISSPTSAATAAAKSHQHHPVDLKSPITVMIPKSPRPAGKKGPPPLPHGSSLAPPTPSSMGAGIMSSPKTPAKKSLMGPPPLPGTKMGPPLLPTNTSTPRARTTSNATGGAGLSVSIASTPRGSAISSGVAIGITPRSVAITPRSAPPPLPKQAPPPLPPSAATPSSAAAAAVSASSEPTAVVAAPHRRTSTIGNIISSLRRPTRSSFVSLGQSDDLARMVQNERDEAAAEAVATAAAANSDDTENIHVAIE